MTATPEITTEMLRSIGACAEGMTFFAEHFPQARATFQAAAQACVDHGKPAYAVWLAQYCPADVPGATWEARLAVQDTADDWARLGRICPAGVPDATWRARLAVQDSAAGRALLGQECPADVPGATWEARLAVQCSAADRALLGRDCPAGVRGATERARAEALSAERF